MCECYKNIEIKEKITNEKIVNNIMFSKWINIYIYKNLNLTLIFNKFNDKNKANFILKHFFTSK